MWTRRETLDCRAGSKIAGQARIPETRAEDVARAVEEVPDTIDGLNKEVQVYEACTNGNPRSRGREPPDKLSPGLAALQNAKESPSDLDTRFLEREAMPSRVSKFRVVAVTGQFATPWSTRAQWSCFWLHLWTDTNSQCE